MLAEGRTVFETVPRPTADQPNVLAIGVTVDDEILVGAVFSVFIRLLLFARFACLPFIAGFAFAWLALFSFGVLST